MTNNLRILHMGHKETQHLTQILSNQTAQHILDALAQGPLTASALAKQLSVGLSTIHYNLKQLKRAGLLQVDTFHYSSKGRVVDHYSLTHKYVIIAPPTVAKDTISKQVMALLATCGVIFLGFLGYMVQQVQPMTRQASVQTAMYAMESMEVVEPVVSTTSHTAWLFLWGAVTSLVVFSIMYFGIIRPLSKLKSKKFYK
ncbi:MAG: ArsR/SmtB family transcription factor [Candidatus Woesearchaeota archaeon]